METLTKAILASAQYSSEAKVCLEKLVVALRAGDTTALKKLCCMQLGSWDAEMIKILTKYQQQGLITSVPKINTKIDLCKDPSIWLLASTNSEAFSPIYAYMIKNGDLNAGCTCPVKDECCDYAGVYAGIGLAASIVFERIEMGKKVRGESNKHGLALGLVLVIIFLLIISNLGSSLSAVWLLVMGAVVFVGMSLIQGRFMQQYTLNAKAKFDDFSSDTSENVVEQSFFTRLDGNQAF